jgi:UDP-N-acetylmuramate dehydrogenase
MVFNENYSLRRCNSFGIDAKARYFAAFRDLDELDELISRIGRTRFMVLGGGSNILFTKDFDGYVLKNEVAGIDIVKEDDDHVYVKAGAGENWHKLVIFCLEHNLAGMENLALIPGNVGASPMQNIGAYGVEVKDVFEQLEAFHAARRDAVTFSNSDCEFGYRESVFKNRFKNQFIITHVTYRLNKRPTYHTSYGAVEDELNRIGKGVTIHTIAQAVMNIRRSKLPDPAEIGNAGSFFKNPTVPEDAYLRLKEKHPGIPGYAQADQTVKLAAGWLIEQAGWKGYREGDAGCHARQALVLVNYGNATGSQIYALSEKIKSSVHEKFGVELEREVNVL